MPPAASKPCATRRVSTECAVSKTRHAT
jgi:hypothetical protein